MPASTSNAAPVIVIGGGISGLACAFRLKQRGVPVLLFEKSGRFGGVVQTIEEKGFLFECGPQSFLLTPPLAELIEAAGLTEELLYADRRAPRYIYTGGKFVAAPMSPFSLLGTPLLDISTKWRLVTEPLRRSRPPEPDESVAAFVRRKFGKSLLDNLVGPFVSGVYAGDPEQLSMRSAVPQVYEWEKASGSVLRGAIHKMRTRPKGTRPRGGLCSLRRGVGSLLKALGESLGSAARMNVSVDSVQRNASSSDSRFEVLVTDGGKSEAIAASAVIMSCDTTSAGRMLASVSREFPSLLEPIPYAGVATVAAGYRREAIGRALDGFGFLVPRKEGLRMLGTVWNSSLFSGRAPEGHVVLTTFAGGATDPEICTWSENRIADNIHEELARVLNIREAPVTRHVQVYARALPQYNLGHSRAVAALHELCGEISGLCLAGNYLEGPSLGACITRAFRMAEEAVAFTNRGTNPGA